MRWPTRCDVSYDDFIRTSADARHRPVVEELWRRGGRAGDLYRAAVRGLVLRRVRGVPRSRRCPEHDAPLEHVVEENWFFRLSRYVPLIRVTIVTGRLRIEPAERRNEVLGFLAGDGARPQRVAAAGAGRRLGHSGARRSRPDRLRVVRRAARTT